MTAFKRTDWFLGFSILSALFLSCSVSMAGSHSDYQNHSTDPNWDVTKPRGKVVNIDFDTTEATQSSVDISPNGKWVVFDLLGHIYRVSSSGGEAQALTQDSGIAINFHPSISPDGQKIAFISDRKGQNNLWVMNIDGSDAEAVFLDEVTRLTSPEWSADGKSIYAVRSFPTYSMHRRSGRIWQFPYHQPAQHATEVIGKPSGFQALWPSASRDGKSLYFMHSTFPAQFTGRQRYQHIKRMNLADGSVSNMTAGEGFDPSKNEAPTELTPEVSPDGKWLAFARRIPNSLLEYRGHKLRGRTALWLLNLETGKQHIAMDPISRDNQDVHGMKVQKTLPGYGWASDSKSLVLSEGGKIRRLWIGSGQVDTIAFKARVQRQATEQTRAKDKLQTGPIEAQVIRWPTVTADGKTAFFQVAGWIFRKALPDGKPQRVLQDDRTGSQLMPAVSPDGRTLAWVSWDSQKLGHLWTMPTKGGKIRRMSDRAGAYLYPIWSPDGELYVTRSATTDPAAIAMDRPSKYHFLKVKKQGKLEKISDVGPAPLAFGPEGRFYWLSGEGLGLDDIQRYLELGMNIPQRYSLLNSTVIDEAGRVSKHMRFPAATIAAPSPDGKWLAFVEQGELFITAYQRSQARYNNDNHNTWRGQEAPYNIIKEDPREEVIAVSEGGAIDPRWVNDSQLIYSHGGEIRIYDMDKREQTAVAANVTIGKPIHKGVLALTNARIITLNNREVLEGATVVIAGDTIQCIGKCDTSGADQILDMSEKTIMPGIVDVHAHGFGGGSPLIADMLSPAALYLSHGVTTVLDPSTDRDYSTMVAELIHEGRLPGPRTYSTGNPTMPWAPYTGPNTYRAAEAEVTKNASLGAISTKIYLTPHRAQRQMLVEASRKFGMSTTNEGSDLLSNIASLLDGSTGLEHAMYLSPVYGDVTQFFAQIKAVYSPTLVVASADPTAEEYFRSRTDLWTLDKQRRFMPWTSLAKNVDHTIAPITEYTFPIYAESVKDIVRAGGYAAIGGHGQHYGLESHWEIWSYAHAMDPMEVLEMASLGGAYMLGMEDKIGSLQAGKLADLIILDANPLEDIKNTLSIHGVMKAGRLYDDETLDQLWPEKVTQPTSVWIDPVIYQDEIKSVGHWDKK